LLTCLSKNILPWPQPKAISYWLQISCQNHRF